MERTNEINEFKFIDGNWYKTKFQTGELFLLKNIIWTPEPTGKFPIKTPKRMIKFEGVYEKCPHLGICPLNTDRLIPEEIKLK